MKSGELADDTSLLLSRTCWCRFRRLRLPQKPAADWRTVSISQCANTEMEWSHVCIDTRRTESAGMRTRLPVWRSCGNSSPHPLPRLCNVERVPRTFGNLLLVEASGPYSCGLVDRRGTDTPVAQWARHPGRIDCSSDSAVESRIEPEGQDFLDIQEMPSFFCPFLSGFAFSSGLNLSGRRPSKCGLSLLILPRVAHPYLYQAPQYRIAPLVCGEEILQSA
jgi:hypothetical protein